MTTDELNAIVQAVMTELEKAGVDFDFKAEIPQADDLVYVMRGTADRYMGITVKWQNLLDIIVQKATEAKNEAVSAKDIALQTLATIQGIESNVSSMKSSVETSEANVASMKASVETSEANVTQMKSDVSTMKASVEGTKTEVEGLKSDVTNLKAQTQTIVDNAKGDVEGLLDTKINKTDALTYEEIMASTPPVDLDLAVAKASALKTIATQIDGIVVKNIEVTEAKTIKLTKTKSSTFMGILLARAYMAGHYSMYFLSGYAHGLSRYDSVLINTKNNPITSIDDSSVANTISITTEKSTVNLSFLWFSGGNAFTYEII